MLHPRNTHEIKFWTHQITTRKYIGPTKYQQEKLFDPRRHDGKVTRDPRDSQWHKTHGI